MSTDEENSINVELENAKVIDMYVTTIVHAFSRVLYSTFFLAIFD